MNETLGLVALVVVVGVVLGLWSLRLFPSMPPTLRDARTLRLDAEAEAMPADFSSMRLTARGPDGRDHVVCLQYDEEGRVSVRTK